MIIPIRCFTCGYPVSRHWTEFKERIANGEDMKKVLDSMGLERYCCRALMMTHKDVLAEVGKFRV